MYRIQSCVFKKLKRLLTCLSVAVALCLFHGHAQAVITCNSLVSTGFSTAYSPTGVVPNSTQGSVTFNCTRSNAGDALVVYLRANNGINVCAGSNDASFSGSCIRYEAYLNSACTGTIWTSNGGAAYIAVNLANVLTTQSLSANFWGCITTANQNPAAGAGTYTDTVTISLRSVTGRFGGTTYATSTFPVSVAFPATCSITSIANVNFGTYVALQTTPLVSPTSNIVLNCTNRLPYTMSLNANTGVISGLNYSLRINSATPPVTSRGIGPGQTHSLVGTISANQAGTCATGVCSGTQLHTLTITY